MPAADTCVTARSFFNIKVGVDSFLPSFVLNNFSLFCNELISETSLPSISENYYKVSSVLIAKAVRVLTLLVLTKKMHGMRVVQYSIIQSQHVQNVFEIFIAAELRWKMLGKRRRKIDRENQQSTLIHL